MTSNAVRATEFEQTITVDAPAGQIFDFLADVRNVPQYLPTVRNAQPQWGERIRTVGQFNGHSYDADGHFRVNKPARRLEWGSDGENDYSGWLEVQAHGGAQSQVKVHIHFAPQPEKAQRLAERSPGQTFEAVMNEGISKTLESIKRLCSSAGKMALWL